ncbi:MAG TPA: hypothetical protein PLC98_03450 [Anaerolineales bacterium]|nr:hypothetical protein [Anaerolineales bacterium]
MPAKDDDYLARAMPHLAHAHHGVVRLLVLVSSLDVYPVEFASQIRALASPRQIEVLMVGLSGTSDAVWAWRRHLTTLAAGLTELGAVRVRIEVASDASWFDAVRRLYRPGDLVVCHRSLIHRGAWPWQRTTLSRELVTRLRAPTCELDVPGMDDTGPARSLAQRVLMWAVPLALITAFAALQYAIQVNNPGPVGMVLLAGTVVVEIILLAVLA